MFGLEIGIYIIYLLGDNDYLRGGGVILFWRVGVLLVREVFLGGGISELFWFIVNMLGYFCFSLVCFCKGDEFLIIFCVYRR